MLSTVESFDWWERLKVEYRIHSKVAATVSENYKSTGYNGFIEREFVDHQSFLNIDIFIKIFTLTHVEIDS